MKKKKILFLGGAACVLIGIVVAGVYLQEALLRVDRLTEEITAVRKDTRERVEALETANRQLKKENQALRAENQRLKEAKATSEGTFDGIRAAFRGAPVLC